MSTEQNTVTVNQPEAGESITQRHILDLLNDLPPESLVVVERFVQFLRQQAQQGQPVVTVSGEPAPPYRYPTVPLPASALDGLIGIMPDVEGDALADTEALYDEV
jgi:hypothetical protein